MTTEFTITTERILKAFDDIKLTIVHLSGQIICHITPLTSLQVRILILLGLSATVYTRPVKKLNKIKTISKNRQL